MTAQTPCTRTAMPASRHAATALLRRTSQGLAPFLALFLGITNAADAGDREQCFEAQGQASIDACTDLIASEKFQDHELAVLHLNRGLASSRLGDPDRALQDYSEAIQNQCDGGIDRHVSEWLQGRQVIHADCQCQRPAQEANPTGRNDE